MLEVEHLSGQRDEPLWLLQNLEMVGRCTSPVIPKTNLNLEIFHKEQEVEHEKASAKSCIWADSLLCYRLGTGLLGCCFVKRDLGSCWTQAKHESAGLY